MGYVRKIFSMATFNDPTNVGKWLYKLKAISVKIFSSIEMFNKAIVLVLLTAINWAKLSVRADYC